MTEFFTFGLIRFAHYLPLNCVCVCLYVCVSLHLTLSWHELYPFSIAKGFSFRKSLFLSVTFWVGLVWFRDNILAL